MYSHTIGNSLRIEELTEQKFSEGTVIYSKTRIRIFNSYETMKISKGTNF